MDKTEKYAVISGACGGLAEPVIKMLTENGYIVLALDISEKLSEKYRENKSVVTFKSDITCNEDIFRAKEELLRLTDKVDLIINFAGIVILGSVIEVPPKKASALLDVNVMGMYRVNHIFSDMLIRARGRIINVSSEYGVLSAIPFHSFYTMSKHAVEIYNDSIRRELIPFGVKVIKIRPGSFKTNMQANIEGQFEQLVRDTVYYKKPLLKMKGIMEKELNKAKFADKILRVFNKAVFQSRPRRAYNINNSFKMKLLSILPSAATDAIFAHYFKMK